METSRLEITEQEYIEQLKGILDTSATGDEQTLLRFLRNKNFDIQKSAEAYNKYKQWRSDENIDQVLNFSFSEMREVKAAYPHGFHSVDRVGHPVYIERIGQLDLDTLLRITTESRLMRYYIREYERVRVDKFAHCSKTCGRSI